MVGRTPPFNILLRQRAISFSYQVLLVLLLLLVLFLLYSYYIPTSAPTLLLLYSYFTPTLLLHYSYSYSYEGRTWIPRDKPKSDPPLTPTKTT